MRVLVDTQAFLWWATTDSRLSSTAGQVISDQSNEIVISDVVGWEIAIK